jgi:4-amino-4-deoxy-L-arabinose transferase-like glycosyltransferase
MMSSDQSHAKMNWVLWALFIFVLYQVTMWFAWVIPSRHYVGFDEGWHLEISQQLYYSLADYGVLGLLWKFIHAMQAKPPLVSLLPVPMYLLFGNHVISATAVNLLWLVLLNVFLFRLVRHFWGDGPALISCIFLQAMPLFQGLSRLVMAEYGATALVVLFMYFLFTKPPSVRRAVALGILMGLGLLEKVLFPTYIAGPLLWTLWMELRQRNKENRSHLFTLWLLSFGIALCLAGPWYLVNFKHLMGYTFQSTYGELAKVYRFGTTLKDVHALWAYMKDFINIGITSYQGILLGIVGLGCWALGRKTNQTANRPVSLGVALWFLFPFFIYIPSLYRNFKFMMPFLAPVSIALAVLLWRILAFVKDERWRWVVLMPLLLWPTFGIVYASFPLGSLNQPYHLCSLGPFEFLPQRAYVGFPQKGRWPYQEILTYVSSDGACLLAKQKRLPSLGMAVDISNFNRSTMLYEQARGRHPVRVHWAPLGGTSNPAYDLKAALAVASEQDYIVFRLPNPTEPEFTNKFNEQIRQKIETGEIPFQLAKQFELPDGAKALVYRKISNF